MIAYAVRTTCVVTALCVAGAGAHGAHRVGAHRVGAHRVGARGAQIARVRAGGPPVLQVGPSCEAAGSGSVVASRNKDSCLADETAAQDTLKQNWPKYLAADKSDCVTLENSGGPASYVELASCLEVMRDARTIRNADPLESDLGPAPVGARRGKRK
jgi:hypothetical protein